MRLRLLFKLLLFFVLFGSRTVISILWHRKDIISISEKNLVHISPDHLLISVLPEAAMHLKQVERT